VIACPQVAERGDSLKMRREAANILNNQLWTANKGWSSPLKTSSLQNATKALQALMNTVMKLQVT
jgi:hypothetical protein